MNYRIVIIFSAIVLQSIIPPNADSQTLCIDLSAITLSPKLLKVNFTSTLVYTFRLDKMGHPIEIKAIKDDFIGEKQVAEAIRTWTFSDIYVDNGFFILKMTWVHDRGWTDMQLLGDGLDMTIYLPSVEVPN